MQLSDDVVNRAVSGTCGRGGLREHPGTYKDDGQCASHVHGIIVARGCAAEAGACRNPERSEGSVEPFYGRNCNGRPLDGSNFSTAKFFRLPHIVVSLVNDHNCWFFALA